MQIALERTVGKQWKTNEGKSWYALAIDGDPKKANMVADTKSKHELPIENKQQQC